MKIFYCLLKLFNICLSDICGIFSMLLCRRISKGIKLGYLFSLTYVRFPGNWQLQFNVVKQKMHRHTILCNLSLHILIRYTVSQEGFICRIVHHRSFEGSILAECKYTKCEKESERKAKHFSKYVHLNGCLTCII